MEAESEQQDPSRDGSVDLEQIINTAKYLADFARDQHLDQADALLTEILIVLFARRRGTFQ